MTLRLRRTKAIATTAASLFAVSIVASGSAMADTSGERGQPSLAESANEGPDQVPFPDTGDPFSGVVSLAPGVTPDDLLSAGSSNLVWAAAPRAQDETSTVSGLISDGLVAPMGARPPWRACAWKAKRSKSIGWYPRKQGVTISGQSLPSGRTEMRCGYQDPQFENKGFGFRHMKYRHESQWAGAAAATNEVSWMEPADDFIRYSLSDPDLVTYRSDNDTFCYDRLMLLVDKRSGETVGDSRGKTVVIARNGDILTAYPGQGRCPRDS